MTGQGQGHMSLVCFCAVAAHGYMNIYLGNLQKPIEFQGHRSTVKVTWLFSVFFCVHDTAATQGCMDMFLDNL